MIRSVRFARFALTAAFAASVVACPNPAPEGEEDGEGGDAASTSSGTGNPASTSSTPASSSSGQGEGGGAPGTTQGSGGDPAGSGGAPTGTGGEAEGTGGDPAGTGGDPDVGSGGAGGADCDDGEARCDDGCKNLTADGDNCGECGHGCLGGDCIDSECQAVTLAVVTRAGALVLDDTHVWFIDEGTGLADDATVMKAPKIPDVQDPAATFTEATAYSQSIALTDTYVVWADFSDDRVYRSPRAQDDAELLTDQLNQPEGLAAVGDDVFVAASGPGDDCITRVDVASGDLDPFPADPKGPSLVVADDTYLYYVDGTFFSESYGDIVRVRHDESERTVLGLATGELPGADDNIRIPTDLALYAGKLYFATSGGVFTVDADGGAEQDPEQVIVGNALRVAVDASGIYWFTSQTNLLVHADFEGNALGTVTNALVNHVALDDDAVYWTENNDDDDGRLRKRAK